MSPAAHSGGLRFRVAMGPRPRSPLSTGRHDRPMTGVRTEIALGVVSPERHSKRSFAHICQKCGKIVSPPRCNRNPAAAALRIAANLWIVAHALHRLPSPVGRRMPFVSALAVRPQPRGADFAVSAAATRGASSPYVAAMSHYHGTAITGEQPMAMAMPIRVRKIHAQKPRIAQPGHVDPNLAHLRLQPCLSAACFGRTDQAAGSSPLSALAAAAVACTASGR